MKLKDYPLVAEAFRDILLNMGYVGVVLDHEKEVKPDDDKLFYQVDKALRVVPRGQTVASLWPQYVHNRPEIGRTEYPMTLVCCPEDDQDVEVLELSGLNYLEALAIRRFFNDFFEGNLGTEFIVPR